MKGIPLFFNCWNQNVICRFETAEGSRWFAALGKHGRNFPIYGSSYDCLMLVNTQTQLGYGLMAPSIPGLRFTRQGNTFSIEFAGKMGVYPADGASGATNVELRLDFHSAPTGRERFFLKRVLPAKSPYVPGAIFDNQWLSGTGGGPNYLKVAGDDWSVDCSANAGHLENGQLSLISWRPWNIPYRYVGIFRENPSPPAFYYEWRFLPWRKASWAYRTASWMKARICKTAVIHPDSSGAILKAPKGPPDFPKTPSPHKLFGLSCLLGEFDFSRALIRVEDRHGKTWWGIEESFRHPDLL